MNTNFASLGHRNQTRAIFLVKPPIFPLPGSVSPKPFLACFEQFWLGSQAGPTSAKVHERKKANKISPNMSRT